MSNARYNLFPSKPAFYAWGRTSTLSISAHTVFVFTNTTLNVDGAYNTSNGRFTCPQDGNYFFTSAVRLDSATVSYWRIRIIKNGSAVYSTPHSIYDLGDVWDPSYFSLTTSGVIPLQENDYVEVRIDRSTGSASLHNESSFSGFLVS